MPDRLLIVGIGTAEWSILQAGADRGAMPQLHRIIDDGVSGRLANTPPLQRAVLWASIATGHRPRLHGVTGGRELRPDGGGVQPAGRRSWRRPAFWEYLAEAGIACSIVNWPATHPARGWPCTIIDDRLVASTGRGVDDWPMPLDCVAPPGLRRVVSELRIHASDIAAEELAALVPRIREVDRLADPRLAQLAGFLAEAATTQAIATHLAAADGWRVLAVCFDLLERVQTGYMRFRASGGDGGAAEAGPYAGVVEAAYGFQDLMIGRLRELAGADTDVLVLSACGCAGRDGRPRGSGLVAGAGPNLARDALIHGATIFDVAPTVLALFGLQADTRMDGRCLIEALASSPPLRRVAPGRTATEPPDTVLAARLQSLGYSDRQTGAQARASREARIEGLTGIAESEMALGDYAEAAVHLESVLELSPEHPRAPLLLAHCRVQLAQWEACSALATLLLQRYPEAPWGSLLAGAVHALAGEADAAAPHLERARQAGKAVPLAQVYLGLLALRLQRLVEAERHFEAACRLRPGLIDAIIGLGEARRARGDHRGAEDQFRRAIGLRFHNPRAHALLGAVLAKQGRLVEAAQSLRIALRQHPRASGAAETLRQVERMIVAQARRDA